MVMGSRLGLEAVVLLKLLKWSLAGMDHLFEIPKKWEHGDPNLTPGDAQFGRGGGAQQQPCGKQQVKGPNVHPWRKCLAV